MDDSPDANPQPSEEIPLAADTTHEVSSDVRRRNLITVGIILAFLTFWILMGLRNALLGP